MKSHVPPRPLPQRPEQAPAQPTAACTHGILIGLDLSEGRRAVVCKVGNADIYLYPDDAEFFATQLLMHAKRAREGAQP